VTGHMKTDVINVECNGSNGTHDWSAKVIVDFYKCYYKSVK